MQLFESFKIAFAMYSKIPMPKTEWKKENMRYSMCFFPLIGIIIGLVLWAWTYSAKVFEIGSVLYGAVAVFIPIGITGGIHFDGLLDTLDALNSFQERERKLEILSDSHVGAFAVIGAICYALLSFGMWSEVNLELIGILMAGFVLSRALSGLAVVTFPLAKSSGLAASFSDAAQKNTVGITMIVYILVSMSVMLLLNPLIGMVCFLGAFLTFWYYKRMSVREFGGLTGDLAGYFLQICELVMVCCVVFAYKLSS